LTSTNPALWASLAALAVVDDMGDVDADGGGGADGSGGGGADEEPGERSSWQSLKDLASC
jgi:hypothetical protein